MPHASFLPEDYLAQRAERRTSILSLTLFIVVMTAVVGAFLVTNRQWSRVKVEQQEINIHYTEAAKRIGELEELERQKQQLVERAEVAAALVERVPRSILLAELINRMPDAVSLQEFDLKSEKEKVKRPAPSATKVKSITGDKNARKPTKAEEADERKIEVPSYMVVIEMEGIAPSNQHVAEYLTKLGQCSLLRDVELRYSKESKVEEQSVRVFRIRAILDPKADAKQFEPLKLRRTMRDPTENTLEFEQFDPSLIEVDLGEDESNPNGGK
ncbi:MAG: PilN domain-containing protein [Phycisphaerales bacterium]|nr:PilN domain-containing protein [Phycisphaerales bacterium]